MTINFSFTYNTASKRVEFGVLKYNFLLYQNTFILSYLNKFPIYTLFWFLLFTDKNGGGKKNTNDFYRDKKKSIYIFFMPPTYPSPLYLTILYCWIFIFFFVRPSYLKDIKFGMQKTFQCDIAHRKFWYSNDIICYGMDGWCVYYKGFIYGYKCFFFLLF